MMTLTMHLEKEEAYIQQKQILLYCLKKQIKDSYVVLSIENAYGDEILSLRYKKAGFRFFRSSQPQEFLLRQGQKEGKLLPQERFYEWQIDGSGFRFLVCKHKQMIQIIMRQGQQIVALAKGNELVLRQPMYGAECCLFAFFAHTMQHLQEMEPEVFDRIMNEVNYDNVKER